MYTPHFSETTTPPPPHTRPFIAPNTAANTSSLHQQPIAAVPYATSIANHPNYKRLLSRGYTPQQITQLVNEHLHRQEQPAQPSPSSSFAQPYQQQHLRRQTHVPVPPRRSIETSPMFQYNNSMVAADAHRTAAVPTTHLQNASQMVAPRATVHLQTKPDKSAIEEVYQNVYQSRQQDVPREQIAVQQHHTGGCGQAQRKRATPIHANHANHANHAQTCTPQHHLKSTNHTHSQHAPHSTTDQRTADRRRAFEAEMTKLKRDEAAAFQLLDMPQQYDLKLLAKQYRKAALKYHPDRVRRHAKDLPASHVAQLEGMFEKVTKAYLLLMERHTQQEENRPFYELRERSRAAMKEQQQQQQQQQQQDTHQAPSVPAAPSKASPSDSTASRVRLGGNGDQFDVRLFNKIYNDHRLHAPSDDGYGEWFQSNSTPDFDPDNPPKLFSSRFNKDIFNTTFNQLKRDDPYAERQLAKREEMGVVVHGANTSYSTLGEGVVDDYGGNTASLQYSDLKSAHTTNATLIDASRVTPDNPTFRNIEDIEAHRSQVSHRMSPEEAERQARFQKQREMEEVERRERVRYMDQLGADQEQRLGQLLLR